MKWNQIYDKVNAFVVVLGWLMVSGKKSKKPNYAVIARYAERLAELAYEAADRQSYAWNYRYTVEMGGVTAEFEKVCDVGKYIRVNGADVIHIQGCFEDVKATDRIIYYHFSARDTDLVAEIVEGDRSGETFKIVRRRERREIERH